MRRSLSIALLLCLLFVLASGEAAPRARPAPVPAGPAGPPATELMEVATGEVLQATSPHRRLPPASLDKLMTLYLALQALHAGRLTLETPVTVSAEAWRVGRTPGSSRMFLNAGDVVTVRQLLEGLMVASGNDAAEALAEAVAGTSARFVELMNAEAARLGMRDTHFVTPHGLPAPGEYTSAWDMALLARRILLDYPEALRYSSPRYETYAGIRQANWNNLIFRDPRVDGLKTGHTEEAGYSIVATAREGPLRVIAVVMGARTLRERTVVAEKLLDLGFSRYALVPLPWSQVVPGAVPVYGGRAGTVPVTTPRPVEVLVRRGTHPTFEVSARLGGPLVAPVRRGQILGALTVRREGRVVAASPLVAASGVDRGGPASRVWGYLRYLAVVLFHRWRGVWEGTYSPTT
jgi:D-alanyl-D-alanine carboxypeptidase (penicillin-binding protein 5/6)